MRTEDAKAGGAKFGLDAEKVRPRRDEALRDHAAPAHEAVGEDDGATHGRSTERASVGWRPTSCGFCGLVAKNSCRFPPMLLALLPSLSLVLQAIQTPVQRRDFTLLSPRAERIDLLKNADYEYILAKMPAHKTRSSESLNNDPDMSNDSENWKQVWTE